MGSDLGSLAYKYFDPAPSPPSSSSKPPLKPLHDDHQDLLHHFFILNHIQTTFNHTKNTITMLSKIIAPVLAMTATLMGAVAATPVAANVAKRDEQTALTSGRITYSHPGACGVHHTDADYVVALSKYDFDPHTPDRNPNHNTLCGKYLLAAYNGKTVNVMVADRCEACNSGDIDLSPVAFRKCFIFLSFLSCPQGRTIKWLTTFAFTEALADLSVSVIQGTWERI
jgi:hypothetical protein